jgi:hypothetical protein
VSAVKPMGSIFYYQTDGKMARALSRLPDWIFSGPGKRRALNALFLESPRTWTRGELAAVAGQHKKARMDRYLDPLVQAGAVRRVAAGYTVVDDHPIVEPLRALLIALNSLPDEHLER